LLDEVQHKRYVVLAKIKGFPLCPAHSPPDKKAESCNGDIVPFAQWVAEPSTL
jgi:hypothetical protein